MRNEIKYLLSKKEEETLFVPSLYLQAAIINLLRVQGAGLYLSAAFALERSR